MDRRTILLVGLAFLIIACTTCNTTTTLPSTATEDAVESGPLADPGNILLLSDEDGEPGSEIDSFPTTQRVLHFKVKVDPLNEGQKIHWLITVVDAVGVESQEIGDLNMDISQDGVNTLEASLSNEEDWPAGLYWVEVYVDDELIESGEFLVVEDCLLNSASTRSFSLV